MILVHRKIDINADRAYVLERHCRVNYACDTPWKRVMPYEAYRAEWFGLRGQTEGFMNALAESCAHPGTLAEILLTQGGEVVGYLWAPFCADDESGFKFAEIQDIYIEERFRQSGIAAELFVYAEDNARAHGARVIRSGTGCENAASMGLHSKMGYYRYRFEYEKEL